MAKKSIKSDCIEVPETLADHPFYGLQLDEEQKVFRDAIWNPEKDIVFCNAKAGCGKSLIAVGTADLLIQYGRYKKIYYVFSPCCESRVGFLPGTIESKELPYATPLFDAMGALGINPYTAIDSGDITASKYGTDGYIKPISDVYMRGCNLSDAVVIFDEFQNFNIDNAKKVLTRVCKNTKVICIGHTGQNDLQHKEQSGFAKYIDHFAKKNDGRVAICKLTHSHRSWVAEWADELE